MFKRKKQEEPDGKNKRKKLEEILELPKEVISDKPRVTIVGFEQMLIENYKGILEYEEFFVIINTHLGVVNINGYNLNLENMTNDDIKVKGKIESLDIERTIDEG